MANPGSSTVVKAEGAVVKKKRFSYNYRKPIWHYWSDYLFILPKFIVFLGFIAVPVIWAFVIAFQEYGVFDTKWVGFTNFINVFQNDVFYTALWNTFRYTIIVVPSTVGLALILASLIHPLNRKSQTFFRAAFYLPTVTSVVVISMVWRWIFDGSFGLFNYIISQLGLQPVNWLGDSFWSMPSIMIMSILTPPGVGIILYLAAMDSVPESLYEAARIDGANAFTMWRRITLPLLKPTTLYLLVLDTIGAFQIFSQVLLMTQGGPGYSSTTIVSLIYNSAFRDFNFGLAAAQALVLFAIVFVISLIQFKWLNADVEY